VERPSVQILVVVASIQLRNLKFEVRKGSARTVIVCGLVGPNAQRNCEKFRVEGETRQHSWAEREAG